MAKVRRILLLGGIGEAVKLARRLSSRFEVTYSLAGVGRKNPDLPCAVRVGGFGGIEGLRRFLVDGGFDWLIDATHPYAAGITEHAVLAARRAGVPVWAYRRPAWQPEEGDDWRKVDNWLALEKMLADFRNPLFTMGLEPLAHVATIPPKQYWLVRCLGAEYTPAPNLMVLGERGPFDLEEELALMISYEVDVLVSKNSGGSAVAAKLEAARRLRIPVVMLERPFLAPADREFDHVDRLTAELLAKYV